MVGAVQQSDWQTGTVAEIDKAGMAYLWPTTGWDPSALGGLRQLQYLDLNNNRLREIKPLLRLRNIKWLELKNNFLELAEGKLPDVI